MARTKPAKSRKRVRPQKPEPLPWLHIVDELNDIRALLRIVPELTAAIRFISEQRSGGLDKCDHLTRWASQALGPDFDSPKDNENRPTDRFPCLEEMVLAPDALRDAVRWRLWRLSRLIQEALKANLLA